MKKAIGMQQETLISRRSAMKLGITALAAGQLPARAQDTAPGGPKIWLGMDQAELDDAYNQRIYAPNIEQVFAQQDYMNARALERLSAPERMAYGTAPVEGLDLYRTPIRNAPVFVFLHGGTWRTNTSDEYAYIAEPFVRAGAHVVVPDFSPVHEVEGGLGVLVDQVRRAVGWVFEHASEFGGDPSRIHVSGHSSGGHLAGAVLTTDWSGDYGLPNNVVRGGICVSGMFDLEPVRLSWRDSYLHLDDSSEQALSPQRHLEHLYAPVIVAYGLQETPEFQRQSRDFAAAARAAGKPVELIAADGFNHFEILSTFANPYGVVGNVALVQMGLNAG
ncbi:MAG: alpha/beta hydrolase [Gammaproteobacteria bacterium]|nr:alpha/beta hydrolase [Gammaproteobacteria bacterium]